MHNSILEIFISYLLPKACKCQYLFVSSLNQRSIFKADMRPTSNLLPLTTTHFKIKGTMIQMVHGFLSRHLISLYSPHLLLLFVLHFVPLLYTSMCFLISPFHNKTSPFPLLLCMHPLFLPLFLCCSISSPPPSFSLDHSKSLFLYPWIRSSVSLITRLSK